MRRSVIALLLVAGTTSWSVVSSQQLSRGTRDAAAEGTAGMVATAHPCASEAAVEILKRGGNAVDAAVAAAFAIGVVEPDGSGLGGGGGMLIHLANEKRSVYINYYPCASSAVAGIGFTRADAQTGKAILVPGTVAGLTLALERFGTLPLPTVIAPAIRLARDGFPIDGTLASILLDNVALIQKDSATAAIYLRDGFPLMEGDTLRQTDLANTLAAIAVEGRNGFYRGPVAEALVNGVNRAGGRMTLDDLSGFEPQLRTPLTGMYRGFDVVTAPPPHSGAIVLEALNILGHNDLAVMGHYSASGDAMHLMAETLRRTYADRTAFLADPRFEDVPVDALITGEYAKSRFDDIDMTMANPKEYRKTRAGDPGAYAKERKPQIPVPAEVETDPEKENGKKTHPEYDGGHTTHLGVMDKEGNAVSLTQTLGTFFGSGVTVAGVLMNNAMSNFSTSAGRNAIEPGKQPRSSISPTIVLKDGTPFMSVGSPGATRIIATVVELLVNVLDYGMTAQAANSAPRFLCQKADDALHLEGRIGADVQADLTRRGHTLRVYGDFDLFFGGAQLILRDPVTGRLSGSADPRRGGMAIGY